MSTISIFITESEEEILPGIPKYITLESNIPCNIFYTLNGLEPSMDSFLVVSDILLPGDAPNVTIKYLATNGVNSITGEYTWNSDKALDAKIFSNVIDAPVGDQRDLYPFGSPNLAIPGQFDDISLEPVDDPNKPNVDFMGYNADGEPDGYTDKPLREYALIAPPGVGERPNNLGNFGKAANVIPDLGRISQFTTTTINKLFNPRALVMYQDGSDPNIDPGISTLNKQFFFTNELESAEGAAILTTPAAQGTPLGGAFLKYYINVKEQTIKFYYFDSQSGRWIISTEPYNMSKLQPESLANLIFPPAPHAARHVYPWIPYVTNRFDIM